MDTDKEWPVDASVSISVIGHKAKGYSGINCTEAFYLKAKSFRDFCEIVARFHDYADEVKAKYEGVDGVV